MTTKSFISLNHRTNKSKETTLITSRVKMNNNNKINQFIEELSSCIPVNYRSINDIFNSKYDYHTLDSIRDEICKCIICGLNQSAITLTNHLLEKSLKFCLGTKYNKEHKKENEKVEEAFVDGINKYDKLFLNDVIDRACIQALITKEQKIILKQFKDAFRNPYSHADTDIFKDMFVKGKTLTIKDLDEGLEKFFEKCFDNESEVEIPMKNLPFAHGMFQMKITADYSVPYFRKVDEIIRYMLINLKK